MAILLLIILLMIVGVNYIKDDKFVQLAGNVTVTANNNKDIVLNYPTGFNKENSVIVSQALQLVGGSTGYNYNNSYSDSMDAYYGNFRRIINLRDNDIFMKVYNPMTSESITLNYKIVLMKID